MFSFREKNPLDNLRSNFREQGVENKTLSKRSELKSEMGRSFAMSAAKHACSKSILHKFNWR
uniref:Uncharacterized protein n=1 Tax=Megaselia scalaris TaxID=36166 RepID=T1GIA4_MEGSC